MDKKDIGALWERTKNDKEYMTGNISIEGKVYEIVVFRNGYKDKPTQPDWRIYPSTPKDEVRDDKIDYPQEEIDASSIPF